MAITTDQNRFSGIVYFEQSFSGLQEKSFPVVVSFVIIFAFEWLHFSTCLFDMNPVLAFIVMKLNLFWKLFVSNFRYCSVFFLNENFFPIFLCAFEVCKLKQLGQYFELVFGELLLVRRNIFFFFPF
jgi:hypothetical protein